MLSLSPLLTSYLVSRRAAAAGGFSVTSGPAVSAVTCGFVPAHVQARHVFPDATPGHTLTWSQFASEPQGVMSGAVADVAGGGTDDRTDGVEQSCDDTRSGRSAGQFDVATLHDRGLHAVKTPFTR